jgi:hypothetical protein
MRLTKEHKDAFIRGVMRDIPFGDFDERAQKIIDKDMLKQAPPAVVAFLMDKHLRTYLITGHYTYAVGHTFSSTQWGESVAVYRGYAPSAEALKEIEDLVKEANVAKAKREELRTKVKLSVYGFSTRATALKALPEFEKYLPEDEGPKKTQYLPAVANLAAELSRAGWPK